MNAHSFERAPFLVRAPLLVREIILALLSEADDYSHPLVAVFGYDKQTFEFVQQSTAPSLLRLAQNYVKSNAITFTVNERLLQSILRDMEAACPSIVCRQACETDQIFNHRQVVRELVMFLVDSLAEQTASTQSFITFKSNVRHILAAADARKLQYLANQMVERRCVQFHFDKNKVRERTCSHMRHEHREGIKDILVTKSATYAMMEFLFSEENMEKVRDRRYRLGVEPLKGRPRTAPASDYLEFIHLWTANQAMSALERFLMAHRKFGYGFDVLWTLYCRAKEEGEFTQQILDGVARRQNLACQITK